MIETCERYVDKGPLPQLVFADEADARSALGAAQRTIGLHDGFMRAFKEGRITRNEAEDNLPHMGGELRAARKTRDAALDYLGMCY